MLNQHKQRNVETGPVLPHKLLTSDTSMYRQFKQRYYFGKLKVWNIVSEFGLGKKTKYSEENSSNDKNVLKSLLWNDQKNSMFLKVPTIFMAWALDVA